MANLYTLIVVNKTGVAARPCVFQTETGGQPDAFHSLIWLAETLPAGASVRFNWRADFSFVYAQTRSLAPKTIFRPAQLLAAELETRNETRLTSEDGSLLLTEPAQGPVADLLFIVQDGSIPLKAAAVGIGMNGGATLAGEARPNLTYQFTPHMTYWLTVGDHTTGEVIDVHSIEKTRLDFPANVFSLTVTLREDGSVDVRRTED